MAKYEQLKAEERHYIQIHHQSGVSMTKIAKALNRSKGTISRELKRNTGQAGYCFTAAQTLMQMRHSMKSKAVKWTEEIGWEITSRLLKKWSPEQIVNDLRTKNKPFVSIERTYQFVREDKSSGGKLYLNLRHAKASYARGKNKSYKGKIKDRVDISERPSVVDDKSRVGDWEADTMVGKGHQGFLVTLTERFSKFNLAIAVPSKEAEVVKAAISKALAPFKNYVHTLTFDNGLEFAQHREVATKLDCKTFFAKPYCSWQRGLNENHNGLLRQYFPKSMPLNLVTQEEVDFAISELNNRPRKKLGFKTPREIFSKMTGITV